MFNFYEIYDHLASGYSDKAKSLLDSCSHLNPKPYRYNYLQSLLCLLDGQLDEARHYANEELREYPNNQEMSLLYKFIQPIKNISSNVDSSEICQIKMLNLGCGRNFHKDWINIDFASSCETVIPYDLNQGIPFPSQSVDVVYHSHLIEHFDKDFAPLFIKECYRVLKPGGLIRVVAPDLESIAEQYLILLKQSRCGDLKAQERYEWIMLELLDQMVRHHSGGKMLDYWKQDTIPAEDFIIRRVGSEARSAIDYFRSTKSINTSIQKTVEPSATEIGKFRLSGEIHQWMYDQYSLGKILRDQKFINVNKCRANESEIPNFNSYNLDIEKNGSPRKPDSLYMEGIKPI